jgi:ubiquinone/menaquinone biosynthesis C-methylase UbiE
MTEQRDSFLEGLKHVYDLYTDTAEGDQASFHFGGSFATEALADKLRALQVSQDCHVLDLCCGWGGASQYIAGRFGCRVTGVDINPRSVERARALAQDTPARTPPVFLQSDACAMPLDPESVNLIWSQDAFCHIPDRPRLLRECVRVLSPAGHLVFSDFLLGEYLSTKEFEALSEVWFFPGLETAESYGRLLEEAGFEVLSFEDVGREHVVWHEVQGMEQGDPTFLQGIAQASRNAAEQVRQLGKEHYLASLWLSQIMLYMAQGKLRIGRFVCAKRKP